VNPFALTAEEFETLKNLAESLRYRRCGHAGEKAALEHLMMVVAALKGIYTDPPKATDPASLHGIT
jgi:hypothetical protein